MGGLVLHEEMFYGWKITQEDMRTCIVELNVLWEDMLYMRTCLMGAHVLMKTYLSGLHVLQEGMFNMCTCHTGLYILWVDISYRITCFIVGLVL